MTKSSAIIVQDPEIQKLVDEFRDVFRDELPDGLPPQRAVDHEINTADEGPSNRNTYPLSVVQLQEQIKQMDALLKRRFNTEKYITMESISRVDRCQMIHGVKWYWRSIR